MADPITGALVSGGIKLLSGLFGRKKTTTSRVDYKQMVADALAAGFNPMSVLRNGGTTGYTNVSAPTLSTGEFLADALGAGYQAFMDIDADNRQAEFDQVQMDLMRQEIETSQASAEAFRNRSWGATIPQAVTYGGYHGSPDSSPSQDNDTHRSWMDRFLRGGRDLHSAPVDSTPGFFEVENGVTGGPIRIMGNDGEAWGISEVASAAVFGVPQLAWNWLGPNSPVGRAAGRATSGLVDSTPFGAVVDTFEDVAQHPVPLSGRAPMSAARGLEFPNF